MKVLTIRNVDPALARELERERKRRNTSINQTVLDLLHQALGMAPGAVRSNGLRKLSGTWAQQDADDFDRAVALFEQVDAEAEHRALLREVLLGKPRAARFKQVLAAMPDVGSEEDFAGSRDLDRADDLPR